MSLLLLPNQLFPIKLLDLDKIDLIILIEEPRYFCDYKFHKLKLMYHRASMKKYMDLIKKNKIKCEYYEYHQIKDSFYNKLNKISTTYFDPIDHKLDNYYKKIIPKANKINNLNFLLTPNEVIDNKDHFYKNNKYSHEEFYKFQRRKLDILMKDDKPIGRWSYDTENRNSLPKNIKIPKVPKITKDKYYRESLIYIQKHFFSNYGSTDNWSFPIDTKSAIKWLKFFIEKKLNNFGSYQDAVVDNEAFLFHSVISPMMNIGILPDTMVIDIVKSKYNKSIPIASYEGFIRQIIGWRNYVYSIYLLEPKMYYENKLNHTNNISDKYWLATTNITPIDDIIKKIVKYSYCHHIERLMYLSNWFLINQINPKDVHRIFMEWTIDAYDWVMVPNIMGMGQFSDGGKMMTRMYFSSSNYIYKLSNYKKKNNWAKIWDAKYYAFINKHYDLLKSNYATSRQTIHWKNKTAKEKSELLLLAKHVD